MNINELASALDKAGARVQDLQDKKASMAVKAVADPESVKDEDIKKVNDDLADAKRARDLAQQSLDDARNSLNERKPNPVPAGDSEPKNKKNVVAGLRDMVANPYKFMNLSSSRTDASKAGLTIPDDQRTQINTLMRQYTDLRDLVTIENVGTDNGTRNIDKLEDIKPMDQMDDIPDDSTAANSDYGWQDQEIKRGDDPALDQVAYRIHDYGNIFYIPNDLLQDSDANIEAWLNEHIARKNVVTYNDKIIKLLPNSQKKATITSLDDMFDAVTDLDMALWSGATLFTNKSGYRKLAKVRLGDGSRAMKNDPLTQTTTFSMDGVQYFNVRVVEDRWLPNNTTAQGKYQSCPFFFGNFKEFIHIFDRQQMNLLTTNIGGKAFEKNQTAIRAISRFDTKIWDNEAVVAGSFDKIADQPLIMPSASVPSADTGK